MAKHRPIPRTLSEAVLKVVTGPLDPSYLVDPEQLMAQVPLLEPELLFQQAEVRPAPPPEPEVRPTELKSPDQLFGRPSSLKRPPDPKKKL